MHWHGLINFGSSSIRGTKKENHIGMEWESRFCGFNGWLSWKWHPSNSKAWVFCLTLYLLKIITLIVMLLNVILIWLFHVNDTIMW